MKGKKMEENDGPIISFVRDYKIENAYTSFTTTETLQEFFKLYYL
jgi:hypothetical protein